MGIYIYMGLGRSVKWLVGGFMNLRENSCVREEVDALSKEARQRQKNRPLMQTQNHLIWNSSNRSKFVTYQDADRSFDRDHRSVPVLIPKIPWFYPLTTVFWLDRDRCRWQIGPCIWRHKKDPHFRIPPRCRPRWHQWHLFQRILPSIVA